MKDLKFGVIPQYNKTYNGHFVPFSVQMDFIREYVEIDKAKAKMRLWQRNAGVSQQRELLLDFWMKMPKTHKHKGVAEHYIDNYILNNI